VSVSLTCRHCNEEMSAEDEEQLVAIVQQHVGGHAAEHGRAHTVSREDVLARLRLQRRRDPS
jgi:hypothetical protein